MRRRLVLAVLAGAVAAWGAVLLAVTSAAAAGAGSAALPVSAAGPRARAIGVPGLSALNADGNVQVSSVSCASPGNCAAGGSYVDRSGRTEGFVVSQRQGVWGQAIGVPGLGALNTDGQAQVSSVSCASAGNCAAGGTYFGSGQQGFVVSEQNGGWRPAVKVPGLGALHSAGDVRVYSVSCASAGNCTAGGTYYNSGQQGFVVSLRDGVWHWAIEVPGLGALNAGGYAQVSSVSCGSAGNCTAGGYYLNHSSNEQGFVVSQRHGAWGLAIAVTGPDALNEVGSAGVSSVSCASAGNCTAGGTSWYHTGGEVGFVASQRHGAWGQAIKVPGVGALKMGGNALLSSVSCGSAGNCAAVGSYYDQSNSGFMASERNSVWHWAIEVPGLAALNADGNAEASSVSCGSAGNCAAGGFYTDSSGNAQGFVVSQRDGVWHLAFEVPGLGALNAGGNARVYSVSCASAGNCAAGGFYTDSSGRTEGFLVSQRNGVWGQATAVTFSAS
jgi:hypothetical protein